MAAPINPKGAKSDKIWRDAIMRAVRRRVGDPIATDGPECQRLERLADALVAKGLESDVPALKEIGDRLDGKAVQALAGPDGEGPIETFTRIELVSLADGSDSEG